MKTVFLLQHLNTMSSGEEDVKTIGIFSSKRTALDAIDRLSTQPGFCENPNLVIDGNGFYLNEYKLDKGSWEEGFVEV